MNVNSIKLANIQSFGSDPSGKDKISAPATLPKAPEETPGGAQDALAVLGETLVTSVDKKQERKQEIIDRLEKDGFKTETKEDGTMVLDTSNSKDKLIHPEELEFLKVSEIKGDIFVYNDMGFNYNFKDLEKVSGNMILSNFDYECRQGGAPNYWYACMIEFPKLKEVGGLDFIHSGARYDLPSLETIKGDFSIDQARGWGGDNSVNIPNIKNIEGDVNIQYGVVYANPSIFAGVKGKMNTRPSEYGGGAIFLKSEHDTKYGDIYFEFQKDGSVTLVQPNNK